MTEEEPKPPESPPAAPVNPGAAEVRPYPEFAAPEQIDPPKAKTGWRDGLRDLGRGMEFGAWAAALASIPVVAFLFGVSLGLIQIIVGLSTMVRGVVASTGRSAMICLVICGVSALPMGLAMWLIRGALKRLGRPGADLATRKRRRRRRWAAVAALGLVAILVGVGATIYLHHYSTRVFEEAAAEVDADDPYWRLDDLMATREEIADDDNAALVVADVYDLIPQPWPATPAPGDGPRESGDLEFATALERATDAEDSHKLDEETAAAFRAEMDKLADAVGLARTLVEYDRGRHELEIGPKVIDTLLPDTQNARVVARLLNADAILLAHDGKLDEALDSCRAILVTARSIGDEPFLISQLVRIAIDALDERLVRRVLAQGEPSDEALADLQSLLENELYQPRLWWGLRGERASLVEMIRRIGDGEMTFDDSQSKASATSREVPGLMVVGGNYQIAVALRWFEELLAIPNLPESDWDDAYDAWDAKIVALGKSRLGKYTTTFPLYMMPAIRMNLDAEKRIRAVLGSLVLLVASERHRQATGEWPASVEDIDPDILFEPPHDPYTGEPYRMTHADGRLRIYSLGPNRKDEGGAYDLKKWTKKVGEDDVGTFAYDPELRGRPATEAAKAP